MTRPVEGERSTELRKARRELRRTRPAMEDGGLQASQSQQRFCQGSEIADLVEVVVGEKGARPDVEGPLRRGEGESAVIAEPTSFQAALSCDCRGLVPSCTNLLHRQRDRQRKHRIRDQPQPRRRRPVIGLDVDIRGSEKRVVEGGPSIRVVHSSLLHVVAEARGRGRRRGSSSLERVGGDEVPGGEREGSLLRGVGRFGRTTALVSSVATLSAEDTGRRLRGRGEAEVSSAFAQFETAPSLTAI